MQTAFVIHMGDGPSIRKIIRTTAEGETITASIFECDENFTPKGPAATLVSTAKRKPWKKRLFDWSGPDTPEAIYHHNMRRHYQLNYSWRYELNATLSDPL